MNAARPRVKSHWLLSPWLPAVPVRASISSIQKSFSVLAPAPDAASASKIACSCPPGWYSTPVLGTGVGLPAKVGYPMSLFAATAGVASSVLPTTAAIAAAASAPRAVRPRLLDAQTTSSIPLPVVTRRRVRRTRGTVPGVSAAPQSFSEISGRTKPDAPFGHRQRRHGTTAPRHHGTTAPRHHGTTAPRRIVRPDDRASRTPQLRLRPRPPTRCRSDRRNGTVGRRGTRRARSRSRRLRLAPPRAWHRGRR